ncbi:unnamed protein product [Arctogadus glacialis]
MDTGKHSATPQVGRTPSGEAKGPLTSWHGDGRRLVLCGGPSTFITKPGPRSKHCVTEKPVHVRDSSSKRPSPECSLPLWPLTQ